MMLSLVLCLTAVSVMAQSIPRVDCEKFTPSYCEMYCGFAQIDHDIGLEFPTASALVDWFCQGPSASDLLTCWGCDQTGVDTSKALMPGTTPGTNATYQKILYDWSHVCDSYWTSGPSAAEDTIKTSFNGYPDGWACSASGFFEKQGLGVGAGGANASTSSSANAATTSFSLHAGVPDSPTVTADINPSSSRPLVNGDPPTSSASLRLDGEGNGLGGGDGAGFHSASISFSVALGAGLVALRAMFA